MNTIANNILKWAGIFGLIALTYYAFAGVLKWLLMH